jgi:hypothetical protein
MFLRNVVETQRTTRRHIPEDDTLHNHRCENLKSYINEVFSHVLSLSEYICLSLRMDVTMPFIFSSVECDC